jgi:hypothetical protein
MKLIAMDQIMPGLQVEVKRKEMRKYEESRGGGNQSLPKATETADQLAPIVNISIRFNAAYSLSSCPKSDY